MPITSLDPKAALILIDLQRGILALPAVHSIDAVVHQATLLATAFRRKNLRVVLVNVAGTAPGRTEQESRTVDPPPGWADLADGLKDASDHTVTKHTWGAFTGTGLADYLKNLGVTQVVLGGVATSIGVESTARQAHELGFNVALAVDAMTDLNADAHHNSVSRIFPRLGETGTSEEILELLSGAA